MMCAWLLDYIRIEKTLMINKDFLNSALNVCNNNTLTMTAGRLIKISESATMKKKIIIKFGRRPKTRHLQ